MFVFTTQHVVIVPGRTSDYPGEKLSKHPDNGGRDIRANGYILVQRVSNNLVPVHARQKSMDFKTLIETGRNCRNRKYTLLKKTLFLCFPMSLSFMGVRPSLFIRPLCLAHHIVVVLDPDESYSYG